MTYVPNWPTREKWEADERSIAQWMIETGGAQGDDDITFTREEREEADALGPVAVKQFRAACGQVERAARKQSPTAAGLYDRRVPRFESIEAVEAWQAPVEALEGVDEAAFHLLVTMRDIRGTVKRMTRSYLEPYEITVEFKAWPEGFDHPASPEITRLSELVRQADERRAESNRATGRARLAAINAPDAWDKELERRAELEAYFRDGPLVRRSGLSGGAR